MSRHSIQISQSVTTILFIVMFICAGWLMFSNMAEAHTTSTGNQESIENSHLVAQAGLVNCGRETDADGSLVNPCDWRDFVSLINDLVAWLIQIATAIATLLFMYAGFLYLTSAGNEDQAKQAKGIFSSVAVGFGIILTAWLLVTTVVSLLTGEGWIDSNSELLPISEATTEEIITHEEQIIYDYENIL